MATGLDSLESWLQPAAVQLFNIAAAAGLSPKVSSARRSHAQQALLYRRFLAGQSRFPAAPPGNSMHELGLAFDLWVNDESQLSDLGQVWEGSMGGIWGGHFRDPIHFEAGGDLSDYQAQVIEQTVQDAQQAPTEAPPSKLFTTTDALLSLVPGYTLALDVAQLLGLDPESMRKRGF
jgi:hypothetical protein